MEDLYSVLKLSPNVGHALIVDAYNAVRMRTNDAGLLKKINEAFAILNDPEKRATYDAQLNGFNSQITIDQHQEKVARETHNAEILKTMKAQSSLTYKYLLFPHIGEDIGINIENPSKFQKCYLANANDDFFTVYHRDIIVHIPYHHLLRVIQAKNGDQVSTGLAFGIKAKLFVEIFHMVIYKGAIGFGMAIPTGQFDNS